MEKTEKKKEENELRRKMIGQWRRVIVVKREKCPEKKISLVNRAVVKKPEKMNWENLSEKENITLDGHTDRCFDDSGLRIRNFPVNMKLGELKPIWSSFV